MTGAKILIVQNQAEAARLQDRLRGLGHTACTPVSCGRRAVEIAAGERPDVALVDLDLAGEPSGIEVGERLAGQSGVPLIYLSGDLDEDLLRRADATQPFGYVREFTSAPAGGRCGTIMARFRPAWSWPTRRATS